LRPIKSFVQDFTRAYFYFLFEALMGVSSLILSIALTIKLFIVNVITPCLVELFADLCFIVHIIRQSYYEFTCVGIMFMTRYLLRYANYCHKESEKIVESTW